MSSYGEYTLIEQHMDFSRKLSELDRRARAFIVEMERQKGINGRKQYEKDVHDILSILHSLSKPKILHHNLFSSLHYYLDDQLFSEITDISFFVVEDEKYPISAIYFDKDRWMIDRVQRHTEFSRTTWLSMRESTALLLFFTDYEDLVRDIDKKISCMKEGKVKTKLKRILTRMKRRYLKGMGILADKIILDVKKKIETHFPSPLATEGN